jgi:hypothetical protein
VLEVRKKHGFTPKYPDVQGPTATMNICRHSRCHYRRNSGSTPAGMNNLHIGGPAGQQNPGGSPLTTAAATTTPVSDGKTAAAAASWRTLLLEGPRPRPHTRGEDKPSRPKSRRSDRRWHRQSRRRRNLLWRPPPQHRRQRPPGRRRYANEMAAAPACTGRSPLKSSRTGWHRPPRGGVMPE